MIHYSVVQKLDAGLEFCEDERCCKLWKSSACSGKRKAYVVKNIFFTVEYDGTNFHGWQRQPNARTVQGVLEEALTGILGQPISIDGTSRTDAGVHALGQCATFQADFALPVDRLMMVLNHRLAGGKHTEDLSDVRVTSLREMPEGFHARFSCKGKKYVYRILAGGEKRVFDRNYYYLLREPLDTGAMREAAKHIVGTHDFKCFQAAGGEEKETTVRTVTSLEIFCEERLSADSESGSSCEGDASNGGKSRGLRQDIRIEVSGDGFLYNMVRIITGTLVEVGQGKRTPDSVAATVASCDRTTAGHTAPPQGLYLAEVYFQSL